MYWEVGVDTEHHQYSHDAQGGQGFKDICRFIMKNCAKRSHKKHDAGEAKSLAGIILLGSAVA